MADLPFLFLRVGIAYLIGSLPLGGLTIRLLAGQDPGRLNAHHLGLENSVRLLGAPTAFLAFFVDVVKGFVALGLAGASPWVALAVYVGHLHPVAPLLLVGNPRGRGVGVLFGVLAGLHLFGSLPLVAMGVPVVLFAAALGVTGYATVATLVGQAALVVVALVLPALAPLPFALLLALSAWRHKSNLARLLDGTEVRLGEPPAVRGLDPNTVLAAFMIHPLSLEDLWQQRSQMLLRELARRELVGERALRPLLRRLRPTCVDVIRGIDLPDGRELKVLLIGGPLLPDQIRNHPEMATLMAIRGARLARDLGAESFGLGAFWSTVGDKGVAVQRAVPELAITNGGAFTAGTVKAAVPGLLATFQQEGGALDRSTAAVVGANGVVAFGIARMIAGEVRELILVGRDLERLERSAATLARKHPRTRFVTSIDPDSVEAADLVFTATSDPGPVLFARHVRPGAWVFDLGRPSDVDASVREVPGVHVIPGGVVRPPGAMRSQIDMHFGDGLIPACLAETMIMAATRAFDRASLGPVTRTSNIDFYLREAERLGFEIVTRDERVAPVVRVS